MLDFVIIGGVPSSGSTLLVNLLKGIPGIAVLPETGLLAHGRNLVNFQADATGHDALDWHLSWLDDRAKAHDAIGLTPEQYDEARKSAPNALTALRDFVGAPSGTCLVEKTPENVFSIGRYLETFPDGFAVVTTRDCMSVVQSVLRRGFSLTEAFLIWFSHCHTALAVLNRFPGRVLHCRYEDLVNAPKDTLKTVVDRIAPGTSPDAATANQTVEKRRLSGLLLEMSSWNLESTSWTKSASGQVEAMEPINLLGIDYVLAADRLVFEMGDGAIFSVRELDRAEREGRMPINDVDAAKVADIAGLEYQSSFTKRLAQYFKPKFLRI